MQKLPVYLMEDSYSNDLKFGLPHTNDGNNGSLCTTDISCVQLYSTWEDIINACMESGKSGFYHTQNTLLYANYVSCKLSKHILHDIWMHYIAFHNESK